MFFNPMPKPGQANLTGQEWENLCRDVLLRDNHRCVMCGAFGRFPPHHIVYRSQGGADSIDNLVTLCNNCHISGAHEGRGYFIGLNKHERMELLKAKILKELT